MVIRFLFVVALGLFVPQIAEACACCDSGSQRELVGWSPRGAALVEFQGLKCEDTHALEVWRVGASRPAGCFDLHSETPTARVSCEGLSQGYDMEFRTTREQRLPRGRSRAANFPSPVRLVDARHVRATLELPARGDLASEARVRVFVRGASGFIQVLVRTIHLGAPEIVVERSGHPDASVNPIEVSVYPSPNGRRALVRLRGQNTQPGMGFFPTELFPVRLPEGLSPAALVAATPSTYALPALDTGVTLRGGRDVNRTGLQLHERGDFASSAWFFAQAVTHDPRNAMYRFNLACAYARLGSREVALQVLRALHEGREGCARCREALSRARLDQDLETLRSHPEFIRFVR